MPPEHPAPAGILLVSPDDFQIIAADPILSQLLQSDRPATVGQPVQAFWGTCLSHPAQATLQAGLEEVRHGSVPVSRGIQTRRGVWLGCTISILAGWGRPDPVISLIFRENRLPEVEKTVRDLQQELQQRDRILKYLWAASGAINWAIYTVEQILQSIVDLLPAAFQYPQATGVRLTINEQVYQTANYRENGPFQRKYLTLPDGRSASIEVRWLEEQFTRNHPGFLPEEEQLLQMMIEVVQRVIQQDRSIRQLQDADVKYRSLVEQVPAVVYIASASNLETIYMSPQVEKLLGYSPAEMMANENVWSERIHPQDRESILGEQASWRAGSKPAFQLEYRMVTRDGSIRWIQDNFITVFSPAGEALFYQGFLVDITEQKTLEVALKASEENYRLLFENMAQGVIYRDARGHITLVNPATEAILGLSQAEIQGRTSFDPGWRAIHEDGSPFPGEMYPASIALRTGQEVRDVIMGIYNPQESAYRWIKVSAFPQFHPGESRPYQVFSSFEDITLFKDALTTLHERQAYLDLLLEQMPAVLWTTGRDLLVTSASGSGLIPARREGLQILGQSVRSVLKGFGYRSFDTLLQAHKNALRGVSSSHELEIDGLTFQCRVEPFRSATGAIIGCIGIALDVTQQKQAEMALRESEAKFRSLVQNALDGIVLFDESGRVVEWNRGQEWITGIPSAEVLNRALWTVQDGASPKADRAPQSHDPLKRIMRLFLKREKPDWHGELVEQEYRRRDGTQCILQSQLFPIETEAVRLVGCISRDVTEQYNAAREIEQRNRELTSLLEISQQLTRQHDFGDLLKNICASVVDTIPNAQAASLMLYDERSQEMVVSSWWGHPDDHMRGLRFSTGHSLVGRIFSERQPFIVPDAQADPDFETIGDPVLDSTRSVVGVPLISSDRVIGVVFADNYTQTGAFSASDLRWLQSLCIELSILIENARLFQEVSDGRNQLQKLSRKLVEVQESERRQIARELHDEVGQTLTGLKLMIQLSSQLPLEETRAALGEIHTTVNNLMSSVREMSLSLRPPILDDFGLLQALLWHFERFGAQTGVRVNFQHIGLDGVRLAPEVETACYRIIQEALTNIVRHAHVQLADVIVWVTKESVQMRIDDAGQGFDPEQVLSRNNSFGLAGMRERARLLGGDLSIISSPGYGTHLLVSLPLSLEADK